MDDKNKNFWMFFVFGVAGILISVLIAELDGPEGLRKTILILGLISLGLGAVVHMGNTW